MEIVWGVLDHINQVLGVIGFFVSLFSFLKIRKVDKYLNNQKEGILFNREYRSFIKEINSYLPILKEDGANSTTVTPVLDICDKICHYTGNFPKDELKELKKHIKNIQTFDSKPQIDVHSELTRIKNIIESVGKKNVL